MFPALRKSRYGQTLLALAGLLAISSSFGLHREPDCTTSRLADSSTPVWTLVELSDETSHGCLACLAHRSVSLPRLSGVVLQPGASVAVDVARPAPRLASLETAPYEGRAPPAHS
ncbi:MAG TPA: hypothetical protein VLO07_03740 [Thermoanaerobaculia bacterium]|nr:hypothetical protein [Thermoanaerobaculia bacterium]